VYRKEYDYTDEAVAAAANLTVDHGLKLLYGTGGASAGGRRYLHAQFENLCRRSMIHSWDDDSFRRAFRFFLRKMVVWLNSSHINMVDAVELYGLGIRPTAKPFTISEFGTHEDYTRVVLEPGDLTDVGRRHHMLAPPSWDPENDPSPLRRAHACLVSIRSVKKSDDAMMIFTSDDSSGYRYIQTLGVVSGWRVRYGKSLWGEASEFPSHDTSTTEARTVVLDNEGGVLVHDRKLFHRTMALLPSVAAIEGTHRQLRSSVLAYAQRKYSRLLDGESAWYDQVVDVASALEALFGLPDEGSDLARRVAQRASWLADLSAAERIRLYRRVKTLYGVLSRVLHAGVMTGSSGTRLLRRWTRCRLGWTPMSAALGKTSTTGLGPRPPIPDS